MLVASHNCSAAGNGPEAPVIPGEGSVEQTEGEDAKCCDIIQKR